MSILKSKHFSMLSGKTLPALAAKSIPSPATCPIVIPPAFFTDIVSSFALVLAELQVQVFSFPLSEHMGSENLPADT
jgi:hypothetical protein